MYDGRYNGAEEANYHPNVPQIAMTGKDDYPFMYMDFATECGGNIIIQTVFIVNTEFNTDTLMDTELYVHSGTYPEIEDLCGEVGIVDGGFFHCPKAAG